MELEWPTGTRSDQETDLAPDANKVPGGKVDTTKSPEARREESLLLVGEARNKRNELLLSKATLSKQDFLKYFSSDSSKLKVEVEQQNVGNCYLIAAIHAMSLSPYLELMCRTSMTRLPNGSWQVFIPLMNKEGKKITITPEDIDPKGNVENGGLLPVHANVGIRVLEAAWIKYKFGDNDRSASEGGHAQEALFLFGGDSFKMKSFTGRVGNAEDGFTSRTLEDLSEKEMGELEFSLNNYDPEHEIVTVGSRHDMPDEYKVSGTNIVIKSGHAYSVTGCDSKKQEITLADPQNTSKPITMSYLQFKESFASYKTVEIAFERLLANMKEV